MNITDSIRVTRSEAGHLSWPIDLTEREFRQLLGHTLVALGDNGAGLLRPDVAAHAMALGEFFCGDDAIGDPNLDYSALGTFTTIHQTMDQEDTCPPGLECPFCDENRQDRLDITNDTFIDCQTCGATYSTDLIGGKPSWKQSGVPAGGKRWHYVPSLGRYVSAEAD